MPYINVAKPTGASYIKVNSYVDTYDNSDVAYDSSSFYEGYNPSAYTNIAKPVGGLRIFPGMITGLMIPLTYSRSYDASPWFKIPKPLVT